MPERLENVVDRPKLERSRRMLRICGRKNYEWLMADVAQNFSAEQARHLNVEKDQLGLQAIDRLDGGQPVRRFADNLKPFDTANDVAQAGTGRRLVIGDDDTDAVFAGLANRWAPEEFAALLLFLEAPLALGRRKHGRCKERPGARAIA